MPLSSPYCDLMLRSQISRIVYFFSGSSFHSSLPQSTHCGGFGADGGTSFSAV